MVSLQSLPVVAIAIFFLIKESPEREGLPPTSEIIADTAHKAHRSSGGTSYEYTRNFCKICIEKTKMLGMYH